VLESGSDRPVLSRCGASFYTVLPVCSLRHVEAFGLMATKV
jgi:hypothetical protein